MNLDKVESLTKDLHAGQKRKDGSPYHKHPIRVGNKIKSLGGGEIIVAAAYLHDTIEDCNITGDGLIQELIVDGATPLEAMSVVQIVTELTSPDDLWPALSEYNRKTRKSLMLSRLLQCSLTAQIIKVFDRADNIADLEQYDDNKWIVKYAEESKVLLEALSDSIMEVTSRLRVVHLNEELIDEAVLVAENVASDCDYLIEQYGTFR